MKKIQADCENMEEIGTRLTIEEVIDNQKDLKLPELNYSSSEDDDETGQIPQKIKQMFNVKEVQNKYAETQIQNEKIHVLKASTISSHSVTEKEKFSESVVKANMLDKKKNKFVTIKIEECNKVKITKDGNINSEKTEINNNLLHEKNKSTNAVKTLDLNNLTESNSRKFNITPEIDCTYDTCKNNLISNAKLKKETESRGQGSEINGWIQQNLKLNTNVTPYEFFCTWLSNKATDSSCIGAEYLLKIKPEELPNIISEKLDGQLLSKLLKAIYYMYDTGKSQEGKKYLCYLSNVRRINIASLFLAEGEKERTYNLFLNLDTDREHMIYINKILQP